MFFKNKKLSFNDRLQKRLTNLFTTLIAVNRIFYFLNGGSHEITLTVPLTYLQGDF